MKIITLLLCLVMTGCTTIQIGNVTIKTPRKLCMIHEGTTICTSEMLLNQESVQAITDKVEIP